MIPPIVARELEETVLDYLETTFAFQDARVADELWAFLSGKTSGIFRGPYVQIRLPFRSARGDEAKECLDIAPSFVPFEHQARAFRRLTGRDGHSPQHTLVTTGTGSGKTECFLYPLLDHCYRNAGEPGIKAVILYPMNALAADQARRIAETIWADSRLKNRVTAGMYVGRVGRSESHKTMGPDYLVTDRDVLRKHPPDILLTNYKMLDYLLLRPEDQKIWVSTSRDTLRYLVLDELHTYDGARGSDVACLIRRLKAKLGVERGDLCCVGTSATLAGDKEQAPKDLVKFASKLFGEKISLQSVIAETRLDIHTYLGEDETYESLPTDASALLPGVNEGIGQYIARQAGLWFGRDDLDNLALGKELARHEFLRTLLMALDEKAVKIVEWEELKKRIADIEVDFQELDSRGQDAILVSFLSLIARARNGSASRQIPFLSLQIQLWIREMRRLMREVCPEPRFFWRDDVPHNSSRKGLPAVYCMRCGYSGWVGCRRVADEKVNDDHGEIYRKYFERSKDIHYYFPGTVPDKAFQTYLCSRCLHIGSEPKCSVCAGSAFPVRAMNVTSKGKPPRDLQRCPACDTDFSLRLVGSQAASLSSVAISHLYCSPFNEDKKLLAFTDSVQDASHRAGFFSARTFRFNLRTAIQSVLRESNTGEIGLDEFTDRFFEYWQNRMEPKVFCAVFTPPDLRRHPPYEAFVRQGNGHAKKAMLRDLRKRLSWEVVMEYGLRARVGRTLDKVCCSTACLAEERVLLALEKLVPILRNEISNLEGVDEAAVRDFIVGFLTRAKLRGAVSHDFLRAYAENGGRSYHLSKSRNELMSPFGPHSVRPRFLVMTSSHKTFDALIVGTRYRTWFFDWALRTLHKDLRADEVNSLYRSTVEVLNEAGLLQLIGKKNKDAYSIPEAALVLVRDVARMRALDGNCVTVPRAGLEHWTGRPSLYYMSDDVYEEDRRGRESYYRAIYNSGRVERIFCHEHTSLIDADTREEIERDFKSGVSGGAPADAPNLLTCTPTLEMGIDVGDLSSAMVCNIPPTPTNYLQRIGRAGRTTGNSLILALSNARPHDLYFYANPFEMIAGSVTPPGCYLDAAEVLKRQYTAFCMDSWCTEHGGGMPGRVMNLLAGYGQGKYPKNVIDYAERNHERLFGIFERHFAVDVSSESLAVVDVFVREGGLRRLFDECIRSTQAEIEELTRSQNRLRNRIKAIESKTELFDDDKDALKHLRNELAVVRKLIASIRRQYPLNLFTNYGIIPNYEFPETGVKLRSVILGTSKFKNDGSTEWDSETYEYVRSAGSALRELAPYNNFYADGWRVKIDEIRLGARDESVIEEWRFCDQCTYIERLSTGKAMASCPRCQSQSWQDLGQKRRMTLLRNVGAYGRASESSLSDHSDDRERQSYVVNSFIDVSKGNCLGGFYSGKAGFGFEALTRVVMREINFGYKGALDSKVSIAGEAVPEHGFAVCSDCGVVKPPPGEKEVRHRRKCRFAAGKVDEDWINLYLYRELQSEAIRFMLPVSTIRQSETVATMTACLELGLRKVFKGDPGHLVIRSQHVPSPSDSTVQRNFLVLYDSVPGGTGFLKEFATNMDAMRQMLQEAFDALKSCECRLDESRDGCYRCLYAYRNQYSIEHVSRRLGVDLLNGILKNWDSLERVETLEAVELPCELIQSELELYFVNVLETRLKSIMAPVEEEKKEGKLGLRFQLPDLLNDSKRRSWILEPLVRLGPLDGVEIRCEPDFLLRPLSVEDGILPVALFLDGAAYHVMPEQEQARIHDDVLKRRAIIRSGNYLVWSMGWQDIKEFEAGKSDAGVTILATLLSDGRTADKTIRRMAGSLIPKKVLEYGPLDSLFEYMKRPRIEEWKKLAGGAALLSLVNEKPPYCEAEVARKDAELLRTALALKNLKLEHTPEIDEYFGSLRMDVYLQFMISASSEAVKSGDFDKFEAILRLDDSQAARRDRNFLQFWRMFLNTANILQFLDGFDWLTSELVAAGHHRDIVADNETVIDDVDGLALPAQYEELLEFSPAECRLIVTACIERGLPLPDVGVDLVGDDGTVLGECEMAWMERKVAVFTAEQSDGLESCRENGWNCKVLPIDETGLEELFSVLVKE